MDKQSLVLNYTKAKSDISPLIIEQEEWSVYTGKVTKQEVVKFLLSVINESSYEVKVDCGLAGDELVVPVYCYPMFKDLNYELYASYGELSDRYSEDIEIDGELLQFRLTASETLNYPPKKVKELTWILDCLDSSGDVVGNPTLTMAGNEASTGGVKVYGTAKVSYITERHSYILTAPRRETALDNNYSGVLVGVSSGYAPVVYEMKMPPTIESFNSDSSYSCGSGWTGHIKEEDKKNQLPEVPSRNLVTIVDYCKQETIREYLE